MMNIKHIYPLLQIIILLQTIHISIQQTCYNPLYTNNPGWIAGSSSPYYLGYDCGLQTDNVAASDSGITFTIDDVGCPGTCSGYAYACGEIAAAQLSKHGYYECTMKPPKVGGTVTTCMVASSTRAPYEEIHVKFFGNDTTHVSVGFYTGGVAYQAGPVALKFAADEEYHSYGFAWTSSYIKWYVDNIEISSELGSRPIPTAPNRLVINFLVEQTGVVTDDSIIYSDPNVDRNFIMPASGSVQSLFLNVSFTPVMFESCDNTSGILPDPTNYVPYDSNACSTAHTAIIFDDNLQPGWTDTGSSPHNLKATTYVHSGSNSMSWDTIPGAELYLRYSGIIDIQTYFGVEFWVFGGGTSGQQITAQLMFTGGGYSDQVNLASVLVSGIQQWLWSRVVIPFENFGLGANTTLVGIRLNSVSTDFQGTIYIDDVKLSQEYPICANRTLVVYSDSIQSGFVDGSWGTYDLKSALQVHTGSYAIEWTLYNNDGIKFHSMTPLDTTIWQGISLYVNYQQLRGWQINIAVTSSDTPVGTMGLLDYYSGTFPSGDWVRVVIPFSEFGVMPGTPVDGIILTCNTASYQGIMMIDDVSFISSIPADASAASRVTFATAAAVLALLYAVL